MTQITDYLWVADIMDVREGPTNHVDRVVTVCQDEVSDNVGCAYDFFPMADGAHDTYLSGDPSYEMFERATGAVLRAVEDGEVVMVHCHAGRSRSVCVAAATIAVMEGLSFQDVMVLFEEKNHEVGPSSTVENHCRRFIENYE